jgi:integrase
MRPHEFHTLLGTIKYTLQRRGGVGGRWHYYFRWQNERHRDSTKTTDLLDAQEFTERAIERILNTHRSGAAALTLEDSIKRFLDETWPGEDKRAGNRSYQDYNQRLKAFAKGREKLDLGSQSQLVLTGIVQTYLTERKNAGYAPASVDTDQRRISRLFSWLMQPPAKLTWPRNPAARKLLKLDPVRREVKPPADSRVAAQLMQWAKNDTIFPVLVLMQNCFRPSGCTRVTWSDLRTGSPAHIRVKEKDLVRHIPLSPWASRELLNWKKKHPPASPDERIFPYGVNTAHIRLRRLREKHNLPESEVLGAFRRLSYLRLYEAGVDPQRAAKFMGNSVQTAMKHYVDLAHLTDQDAARALDPNFVHKTSTKRKAQSSAQKRKYS